jgi:hypothetical protein
MDIPVAQNMKNILVSLATISFKRWILVYGINFRLDLYIFNHFLNIPEGRAPFIWDSAMKPCHNLLVAFLHVQECQLRPIFQFLPFILVTVSFVVVVAGWRTEKEKFELRKRFLSCCNILPNSKQVHPLDSNSISLFPPLKTEKILLFAWFQYQDGGLIYFWFIKTHFILK